MKFCLHFNGVHSNIERLALGFPLYYFIIVDRVPVNGYLGLWKLMANPFQIFLF